MGIVGEVANLIDGEQGGAWVVAEAALEGAGGLLAIEIEQQVRGGDEARAVAGQDDLMDDVLGKHRLAEALGADQEDVLGAVEEVEGEDAFERGPVERGRPVPVPIGDRLEAAETGGGEPAFDTAAPALLELGGDEVLGSTVGLQRRRVARAIRSLRSSAVRGSPSRRRAFVRVVGTGGEGIVALQGMGPDVEVADAGSVG